MRSVVLPNSIEVARTVKQLFGTDGMRGVPGRFPLDDATLGSLARALGEFLRETATASPRVLLGMDTRKSGPHIAAQVAGGLFAAGCEPVFAGVITTPGVAWLTRNRGFAAGVVISASHNPWRDNGVKLVSAQGMKFSDAVEAEIERRMGAQSSGANVSPVEMLLHEELATDYLDALCHAKLPGASVAGMRIVLDCANGAASRLAPALFRSLSAEVIAINDQPNGRNINDGCGSMHPETLQATVVKARAALGAAFDGDADRAIFSSSTGRLVNGDGVLLAAARYLNAGGLLRGDSIVGTTMSNLGLERALAAEGLRLDRVPVGDRYVLEEMQRTGANLGGEQSGHIIFLDDATTGDGMLTAVKIASMVALAGTLDNAVAGLEIYPQAIVNVHVASKPPLDSLPAVAAELRRAEQALGDRGRVVLRYSGTEPLARVMVEAQCEEDVHHWTSTIAEAIRCSIGARIPR